MFDHIEYTVKCVEIRRSHIMQRFFKHFDHAAEFVIIRGLIV